MKKTILWFVATLALAQPLIAQPGGGEGLGGGPPRGGRGGRMFQKLGLTPDQQKKIEKMHDENFGKMKEARTKVREAREALKKVLQSDAKSADIKKSKEYKTLQSAMADMQAMHFDHILAIRDILTKEQREKLDDILPPGGPNDGERRGGMDRRGGRGEPDDD